MALTFTRAASPEQFLRFGRGAEVAWVGTITFDNSYPTGGEAIAPSDFGFDALFFVSVNASATPVTKFVRWDEVNSKLLIYIEDSISGICAEAGAASDQSLVKVAVLAIGTKRSA
jgi:hypothetical protein